MIKPEYLRRLAGHGVLNWHKYIDFTAGLSLAAALGLIVTFVLLLARSAV